MMKKTHLAFGFLFFLICNVYFGFPIEMASFALIGAMFCDLDINFMHRKILHNVWVLGIVDLIMLFNPYYPLLPMTVTIFSLGFISHLLADSMTVVGIHWLWPLEFPHISGSVSTGHWKEYVFSALILIATIVILVGVDYVIGGVQCLESGSCLIV